MNIDGWISVDEELFIASNINKDSKVLELGSYKGKSSRAMLNVLLDGSGDLTCVDTWNHCSVSEFSDNVGNDDKVKMLKMLTREAFPYIMANRYDVIFIDAGHRNIDLMRDLCVCSLVTKKLLVHDYGVALNDRNVKDTIDWFVDNSTVWNITNVVGSVAVIEMKEA